MEASVRIFNSTNRHFSNSLLLKSHPLNLSHKPSLPFRPLHTPLPRLSISNHHRTLIFPPNRNPLGLFQSLFSSHNLHSSISTDRFARILSGPKDKPFEWKFSPDGVIGGDVGIVGDKGPIVTVVLLGWLGSKPKHLRRYADFYNARGIHAVTFVASVKDLISFDLGRKLEERILELTKELALWLSESENDGRERFVLFHTFSNTGWLAYGAILDKLLGRQDLLDKIKGCVVDSGGDPDINPKVWAAGFTAALLKKRSSAAYSSVSTGQGNKVEGEIPVPITGDKGPLFMEVFFLVAFEKFFSYILNLPHVNQRLAKIISTLSKDQPPCPQLYLYSTDDKVIPFQSIETFIERQRRTGRKVQSFNFGLSPHVDHYRTFPDKYSSQLQNFLKECLPMVKQT